MMMESKKIDDTLSEQVYDSLRVYVYKVCGINLGPDKKYLVRQRFLPLLKKYNLSSFAELASKISIDRSLQLKEDIINAITTNETLFFRDRKPFDFFELIIMKDLINLVRERKKAQYQRRGPKVRIWCAAASTGQEPYSIAIVVDKVIKPYKLFGVTKDDFEIIATDIDNNALAKAIKGEYTDFEVARGLTAEEREKYFTKENGKWYIKDEIKEYVQFKQLNLIENFTRLGSFDVVFARNVLIYFDTATKQKIIDQIYFMLNNNGVLFIGSTENLFDIKHKFEIERYDRVTIYRKK